ncbi:nuclear cap-binding protein subunit 2B-like [Condylostylus longicornis]|uniref:nuclear cap-binding protein subunit 2B-like n=1 Tax=Condylostylus longicornis TaxID=2530218 RepID=UPI00244E0789|nr:nuclear cap-binding protein subunit 2B-like [Condylostylus longicornis]
MGDLPQNHVLSGHHEFPVVGFSKEEWISKLHKSTTVYVGNLTFYATEDQIYELFSKCGEIDLIVMGLNRKKKSPCGFCFIRYYTHAAANRAVEYLNGIQFDERPIRVDWDSGDGITEEYRKFGRGVHGLQWRDEFRTTFDQGRGGEGGCLDVALLPNRRKRLPGDRQWVRYGHPSRRNVRPRYAQTIPPPPPPDFSSLKPDLAVPQDIKPKLFSVDVMDVDLSANMDSSVKPEPQEIE